MASENPMKTWLDEDCKKAGEAYTHNDDDNFGACGLCKPVRQHKLLNYWLDAIVLPSKLAIVSVRVLLSVRRICSYLSINPG